MSKKTNLKTFGAILFFCSLAFFTIYMLVIYLPEIQEGISNSDALINAFIVAVISGVVATIGAMIAKRK